MKSKKKYSLSLCKIIALWTFVRLKLNNNKQTANIFQNCNIQYVEDTTGAVVAVKPQWSGIKDGLLFSIKHENFEDIKYAEDLLYRLLDKVGPVILVTF